LAVRSFAFTSITIPALLWYQRLNDQVKFNWQALRNAFLQRYNDMEKTYSKDIERYNMEKTYSILRRRLALTFEWKKFCKITL
jgi:hypothetical protein